MDSVEISDFLNSRNMKAPGGKNFRDAHAHSIVKKKKVKDVIILFTS